RAAGGAGGGAAVREAAPVRVESVAGAGRPRRRPLRGVPAGPPTAVRTAAVPVLTAAGRISFRASRRPPGDRGCQPGRIFFAAGVAAAPGRRYSDNPARHVVTAPRHVHASRRAPAQFGSRTVCYTL